MIDWTKMKTSEDVQREALALAKEEASTSLVAWVNATTRAITGPVPDDEKLSWTAKEAAARAYLAGTASASDSAFLGGEALITGEELSGLCARIVANADAYRAAISCLTGLRRKTFSAIDAAATPAEVKAALQALQDEWEKLSIVSGF